MVCKCSSPAEHAQRAASYQMDRHRSELEAQSKDASKLRAEIARLQAELAALTPDATRYEIVDVVRVGAHLVLRVRFASCARCAFEGDKVLVYLDVTEVDALRWRRIDPHFRDTPPVSAQEAPSPAARFLPTPRGWEDAIAYARSK